MAEKITITEALAELKTIKARIQKKRDAIGSRYLWDSRAKDPLLKDGGTPKWIEQERQAIRDLSDRYIAIRNGIQETNVSAALEVNGVKRSVAGWLNWRRELASEEGQWLTRLVSGIDGARKRAAQEVSKAVAAPIQADVPAPEPPGLMVGLDELELTKQAEAHEKTLGDLDGKLSLFNATTKIDL